MLAALAPVVNRSTWNDAWRPRSVTCCFASLFHRRYNPLKLTTPSANPAAILPGKNVSERDPSQVISTILKHDTKVTTYKIALLRAINDTVLSFPDLAIFNKDIAVPLWFLARFWLAYYWPFVHPKNAILQGPRAVRGDRLANDMVFRNHLTVFRIRWEDLWQGVSQPSDGFFIINEFRIPRKRRAFPTDLVASYDHAIHSIGNTIKMPIRYAGPGQWTVFEKPLPFGRLKHRTMPIPGTCHDDECLVIPHPLWQAFQQISLYVEALCIHEWCLFTERANRDADLAVDRGQVYRLLTDRPDNRRPLTWERNHIDILLMEGLVFQCPWTGQQIDQRARYDIDHLLPISVYPINELWNLVPSDPDYNTRVKRDRLPSSDRLAIAQPRLQLAYNHYHSSPDLAQALDEDVGIRFSSVPIDSRDRPSAIARAVTTFLESVADSRNLARF